jgi:hypothetical protein
MYDNRFRKNGCGTDLFHKQQALNDVRYSTSRVLFVACWFPELFFNLRTPSNLFDNFPELPECFLKLTLLRVVLFHTIPSRNSRLQLSIRYLSGHSMFSNIQYFQLLLLKTFAEIPDYFLNGEAEVPNSSLFMQTCWETLNFNYLQCIPVIPCFEKCCR